MASLIVVAWGAYALAERRAVWGLVAGVATVLAFFTKANAAFFVAAIGLDAMTTLWLAYHDDLANPKSDDPVLRESSRLCAGVGVSGQTSIDPESSTVVIALLPMAPLIAPSKPSLPQLASR